MLPVATTRFRSDQIIKCIIATSILVVLVWGTRDFIEEQKIKTRYEKKTTNNFVRTFSQVGVKITPIRAHNPRNWHFEMLLFGIDGENMNRLVQRNSMVSVAKGSESYNYYFTGYAAHIQNLGPLYQQIKSRPDCRLYVTKSVRRKDFYLGEVFFYSPATGEGLIIVFHDVG
ncbi:MAG: hypothetical protein H8F28_09660 [Fibrella sp.]|nr:hypothetical protein [Armatimonadota bacterium]